MSAEVKSATVAETFQLVSTARFSGALIDVREADELAQLSTSLARHVPMSTLDPEEFELDAQVTKSTQIFLLCRSGGRSRRVGEALVGCGFTDVTNVEGGMIAWAGQGLPVKN